jgi:hypothetical protein
MTDRNESAVAAVLQIYFKTTHVTAHPRLVLGLVVTGVARRCTLHRVQRDAKSWEVNIEYRRIIVKTARRATAIS